MRIVLALALLFSVALSGCATSQIGPPKGDNTPNHTPGDWS